MLTKTFLLAGDAIFTIEDPAGPHHTFKIEHVEAKNGWPESYFCKLLTGPDNTQDYTYFGKLNAELGFVFTTAKSDTFRDSRQLKVINRVLARIWEGNPEAFLSHGWKVHHEGRCGRCGRLLTVPQSVESGIGPECAKKIGV